MKMEGNKKKPNDQVFNIFAIGGNEKGFSIF